MTTALLLAALAVAATPQNPDVDSRWVPWLGCWELVDDQRRDPLVGEADPTQGKDVPVRGFSCLHPAPDGNGVTVTTTAEGETFLEETLVADGTRQPSAKGQCNGWQQTEWSEDGQRLFTSAELTCDENRELTISGLSMMAPRSTWVDIQVVESSAGRAVLIRRYRPASVADEIDAEIPMMDPDLEMLAFRGRRPIASPLSAEDIVEAAGKVAPEALEAAVLEYEEGFALDSEALIQLADAGVRPGLIDLMVALSYPEQFVVDAGGGAGESSGGLGGFVTPGPMYGVGVPYSYRHPYYVTPFSYYYYYAPHHPRWVVNPVAVREVRQGLVSSHGYARVEPRPTGRRARPRGGSSSGVSSRSSGSSSVQGSSGSSSSGRGSVSRSGYSRGGSSGRSATRKK